MQSYCKVIATVFQGYWNSVATVIVTVLQGWRGIMGVLLKENASLKSNLQFHRCSQSIKVLQ